MIDMDKMVECFNANPKIKPVTQEMAQINRDELIEKIMSNMSNAPVYEDDLLGNFITKEEMKSATLAALKAIGECLPELTVKTLPDYDKLKNICEGK